jgi:hypothetical protein
MADTRDRLDSNPGFHSGGRVHVPITLNSEGHDAAIDPDDDIYSGMLKRQARQNGGVFTRREFVDSEPRNRP